MTVLPERLRLTVVSAEEPESKGFHVQKVSAQEYNLAGGFGVNFGA